VILSTDNLNFSYSKKSILNAITFGINKGDCLAILGTNGVGKSTLLKCLNNILKPNSGIVYVDGVDNSKLNKTELAKKLGYVSQRHEPVRNTVFDAVLLGRKPHIKWDVSEEDMTIVEDVLRAFGLETYTMRYTDELSGGELQKVFIARALAQQPKVLLMDEPTSNLDLKNQLDVIYIIKDIVQKQNISAIVTMHDLNLALRFANKFMLLKNGQLFAFGGSEIITPRNIKLVYDVNVAIHKYCDIPVVIPIEHQIHEREAMP